MIIYEIVCPRSSDPFYILTYQMKWVTTINKITILLMLTISWTHSKYALIYIKYNLKGLFCCIYDLMQKTQLT